MHAASVYPEPGSNSLNMIYQGYISVTIIPSLSALLTLKSSLFLNSKEFSESFTFRHCCSIFKELRFPPFGGQLCYYIKTFSLCQHFFKSFFKVFFEVFWAFRPCSCLCSSYFVIRFCLPQLSLSAWLLYQLIPLLSITFFHFYHSLTILLKTSSTTILICWF